MQPLGVDVLGRLDAAQRAGLAHGRRRDGAGQVGGALVHQDEARAVEPEGTGVQDGCP